MKGLDLARRYWEIHGAPMIREKFGDHADRIAAGLAGPGSECFGYDDDISRDHDWGPGFCLWLGKEEIDLIGKKLQAEYEKLPGSLDGFGPRVVSPGEEGRVGVIEIETFYRRYTGLNRPPETAREWLVIKEQSLATCTNGRVFTDPPGIFTRWREALLRFYPDDVRLKLIASRLFTAAQSGQYNLPRSAKRGEVFAAAYSVTRFCADIISIVYLLNRRYTPFYKWMHRGLGELPLLGPRIRREIDSLLSSETQDEKVNNAEEIAALIIEELAREGLTESRSDFLLDHAHEVHRRIQDPDLGGRFSLVP